MFRRTGFIALLGILIFVPIRIHASVFGTVKAIVHDPQHRPVQNAKVVVQSRTSAFRQDGTTDDEGVATLLNVPVGEYDVTVESQGFGKQRQTTTVASGIIEELHFALAVGQVEQTLEVTGTPETIHPSSSTSQTLVDREQIAETPGVDRTNSLSVITDFVPGAYMVHDQLHVRG